MKLIIAIVSNDDSSSVINELTKAEYHVTKLATTGGFLRAGNTTLLIGVDDEKVEQCIDIIGNEGKQRTQVVPATVMGTDKISAYPVEVQVGGATIFVLDIEQFKKF